MQIESEPTIIYLLLSLIGVLAVWIITLEWRLGRLFRGSKVGSLEQLIADMGKTVDKIIDKSKHDDLLFEDIYKRLKKTIQKLHTVRFNPFADQGGNHSFTTAIMDEEGDGVILSGLYSRDKVAIYAKPLQKFSSEYELSREEKSAITGAKTPNQK